ncbi:MAG: putative spermidine/putrescine transport system permease protein [Planctomycetaceae bacterium]|jgi:putative spermidine/putrescine transport system permease protein
MKRPYVLTGALFAMNIPMNENVVAFLLSGFSVETLPIKAYNSKCYGFTRLLKTPSVSMTHAVKVGRENKLSTI